ncbi:MAG TPA: alpha/beta hydrolase, partial [Chitinophagaceae bacterium]
MYMIKKTIIIGNMSLSYVDYNEDKTDIIFLFHGQSGSVNNWRKQLDSPLLSNYRLVAVDLPGHGSSGHSIYPSQEYSPLGTGKILSEFVKEISVGGRSILTGFSYGANLVAEIIEQGFSPDGVIILGSSILGNGFGMDKVFMPSPEQSILTYNETDKERISRFFKTNTNNLTDEDLNALAEDYLKVSPDFKPALFQTASEGKISDEINVLQNLQVPVLIIFGENDTLVNKDYLDSLPFTTWQHTIYKIPGSG